MEKTKDNGPTVYELKPSTRKNKKYMLINKDTAIHFASPNYDNYTIHKDKNRQTRYIQRHEKNE